MFLNLEQCLSISLPEIFFSKIDLLCGKVGRGGGQAGIEHLALRRSSASSPAQGGGMELGRTLPNYKPVVAAAARDGIVASNCGPYLRTSKDYYYF